jgi:hypothetical protein
VVLFGSGRSLEMVRAEVHALSRAVGPSGWQRALQYEEFKTVKQTNTKIYSSLLVRGEKMRYDRLRVKNHLRRQFE